MAEPRKEVAYNIRIKVTDVSDLTPTTKLMQLPGFSKSSTLSPYVSVELGDVHLGRTVTREVQSVFTNTNSLNKRLTSTDSQNNFNQVARSASNSTASSKDSALSTTASYDEEFSEIINNIDEDLQLRIFHEALVGEDDFLAEVDIPLRSQVLGDELTIFSHKSRL